MRLSLHSIPALAVACLLAGVGGPLAAQSPSPELPTVEFSNILRTTIWTTDTTTRDLVRQTPGLIAVRWRSRIPQWDATDKAITLVGDAIVSFNGEMAMMGEESDRRPIPWEVTMILGDQRLDRVRVRPAHGSFERWPTTGRAELERIGAEIVSQQCDGFGMPSSMRIVLTQFRLPDGFAGWLIDNYSAGVRNADLHITIYTTPPPQDDLELITQRNGCS